MNLILKIVNNPKENIISQSHEFKKEGGSIGRDPNCTWVLNDSNGELSRIHANIEYKGGEYYLIDVSSNGMLYKLSNHLVPKGELVKLKESEVLCMGAYEILVGFVKGENKKGYISELLNQREVDVAVEEKMLLNKEGNSALEVIMPKESKEKDILEYAREELNSTMEIDFSDAFDDEPIEVEDSVYSSHITAPSFVEEIEEEVQSSNSSDALLLRVLSSRLGIKIEALSQTHQIELMNELADGLLVALEHKEKLEQNAKEIALKLEKPNLKLSATKSKTGKSLLSAMVFNKKESSLNLSQNLKDGFEKIQQQHTALYEASREQSQSLEREFAPENLVKSFDAERGFSLMGRDAENWRAYVTRYHKLNPSNSNFKEEFSFKLYVAYQKVLETLRLSRGGE